jgi:hypothetical protein
MPPDFGSMHVIKYDNFYPLYLIFSFLQGEDNKKGDALPHPLECILM